MATKPKPSPKPEPEPDPDEEDTAALGTLGKDEVRELRALGHKVAALEERMTKLEADAKEPPIRLGSARNPKPGWP